MKKSLLVLFGLLAFAPFDSEAQSSQVRVLGTAFNLHFDPANACVPASPVTFACDPWTSDEVVGFVVSQVDEEGGVVFQSPPFQGKVVCAAGLDGLCRCQNEDPFWATDVHIAAVAYRE